jgi:hypothetical protein
MASTIGNRPIQYRAHAKQARERAAAEPVEAVRTALLHDADLWERMADYEVQNPTVDLGLDLGSHKDDEEHP